MELKTELSDADAFDFEKMLDESMDTPVSRPTDDESAEGATTESEKGDAEAVFVADGEKTLEEKLNDIYNEFLGDVTITIANIKDIAFREAAIKGRWCSRLMAERVRGKRLKKTLEQLVEELGKMADRKTSTGSYLASKMQKDAAINSNAEVVSLRREIAESREIQDFLSNLYDCVRGLGYTVKNSLDVLNLERGI